MKPSPPTSPRPSVLKKEVSDFEEDGGILRATGMDAPKPAAVSLVPRLISKISNRLFFVQPETGNASGFLPQHTAPRVSNARQAPSRSAATQTIDHTSSSQASAGAPTTITTTTTTTATTNSAATTSTGQTARLATVSFSGQVDQIATRPHRLSVGETSQRTPSRRPKETDGALSPRVNAGHRRQRSETSAEKSTEKSSRKNAENQTSSSAPRAQSGASLRNAPVTRLLRDQSEALKKAVSALLKTSAAPGSPSLLSPQALAQTMVAAESQFLLTPLKGDKVRTVMREGVRISDASGLPALDVVKQLLIPFMQAHLADPGLIQAQQQSLSAFDKVADQVAERAEQLKGQSGAKGALYRDDAVNTLLAPVLQPLLNHVLGEGRTIDQSRLPKAILDFLSSLDAEIIRWFDAHGSGHPDDLVAARKNAIVGILSTRSVTAFWQDARTPQGGDNAASADRVQMLKPFLNDAMKREAEAFARDLMVKQTQQSDTQRDAVKSARFGLTTAVADAGERDDLKALKLQARQAFISTIDQQFKISEASAHFLTSLTAHVNSLDDNAYRRFLEQPATLVLDALMTYPQTNATTNNVQTDALFKLQERLIVWMKNELS